MATNATFVSDESVSARAAGDYDEADSDLVTAFNSKFNDQSGLVRMLGDLAAKGDSCVWLADILVRMNLRNHRGTDVEDEEIQLVPHDSIRSDFKPDLNMCVELVCRELESTQAQQSIVMTGATNSGKTDAFLRSTEYVLRRFAGRLDTPSVHSTMNDLETIIRSISCRGDVSGMLSAFKAGIVQLSDSSHVIQDCRFVNLWITRELASISSLDQLVNSFNVFRVLLFGAPTAMKQAERLGEFNLSTLQPSNKLEPSVAEQAFEKLNAAFKRLRVSTSELSSFWQLVSCIAHFYNTQINQTMTLLNEGSYEHACSRINVDPGEFFQEITQKWKYAKNAKFSQGLKTFQEVNADLHMFAAFLYSKLANWVISKINSYLQSFCAEEIDEKVASASIILLDTPSQAVDRRSSYGAENMALGMITDYVEHYYDDRVFRSGLITLKEQKLKKSKWPRGLYKHPDSPIERLYFINKNTVVDTVAKAKNPAQLHENIVRKYKYVVENGESGTTFFIKHYLNTIRYDCDAVLRNNRSTPRNMVEIIHETADEFQRQVLNARDVPQDNNNSERPGEPSENSISLLKQAEGCAAFLLSNLRNSRPTFVRCIDTVPVGAQTFSDDLVYQQVVDARLLETVRVRSTGFAVEFDFALFIKRYGFLAYPATSLRFIEPSAVACQRVFVFTKSPADSYRIGSSKVMLKHSAALFLQAKLRECDRVMLKFQRMAQRFLAKARHSERRAKEADYSKQRNQQLANVAKLLSSVKKLVERTALEDIESREERNVGKLIKQPVESIRLPAAQRAGNLSRGNCWASLLYMEYGKLISTYEIFNDSLLINSSDKQYDLHTLGLGACCTGADENLMNLYNDSEMKIQFRKDRVGNLFLQTTSSKSHMRIHACSPERTLYQAACISPELAVRYGQLINNVETKVFDYSQYLCHVAAFVKAGESDIWPLIRQCCTVLQVMPKSADGGVTWPKDMFEVPMWFIFVDLAAVTSLESDRFICDVSEVVLNAELYKKTNPKQRWARQIHEHRTMKSDDTENASTWLNGPLVRLMFRGKLAELTMSSAEKQQAKLALQFNLEEKIAQPLQTLTGVTGPSRRGTNVADVVIPVQSDDDRRETLPVTSEQLTELKKTLRRGTADALARLRLRSGQRQWAKVIYEDSQTRLLYSGTAS